MYKQNKDKIGFNAKILFWCYFFTFNTASSCLPLEQSDTVRYRYIYQIQQVSDGEMYLCQMCNISISHQLEL